MVSTRRDDGVDDSQKGARVEAKILVIEDALESWTLLSSMLLTHRYQPIWAADGIQALSEARKHQPHAILLIWGCRGETGLSSSNG